MPTLSPPQIRRLAMTLAGGRVALGALTLLAPRRSLRCLGWGERHTASSTETVARLFAVREIVLGTLVLERLRFGLPEAPLLKLNAACDGLDALVMLRAGGRGRLLLGVPAASTAAAAWWTMAASLPQ